MPGSITNQRSITGGSKTYVDPMFLFSLEHCSNLSELMLDMKSLEFCGIKSFVFILSTLNLARSDRLRKSVLTAVCRWRWFDTGDLVNVAAEEEEDDDDDEANKKVEWTEL